MQFSVAFWGDPGGHHLGESTTETVHSGGNPSAGVAYFAPDAGFLIASILSV